MFWERNGFTVMGLELLISTVYPSGGERAASVAASMPFAPVLLSTSTGCPSVASASSCRSALAIEAHRGVASLANTLGIGCALRLALRSDGCAQPTTSDR